MCSSSFTSRRKWKIRSVNEWPAASTRLQSILLAVILGSLALLKKGISDDPRTSRLLEGAIQRRRTLVTDAESAICWRSPDVRTLLEAVEIQQLVPDLLDFLRQSVGPTVTIEIDIPADLHPVKIDANQFELALMNLAVNARDAMPRGGVLTISCRDEIAIPTSMLSLQICHVKLCAAGQPDADTGVGMRSRPPATGHGAFLYQRGSVAGHRGPAYPWCRALLRSQAALCRSQVTKAKGRS